MILILSPGITPYSFARQHNGEVNFGNMIYIIDLNIESMNCVMLTSKPFSTNVHLVYIVEQHSINADTDTDWLNCALRAARRWMLSVVLWC
jgi:hypothetical protein